MEDRQLNDQIVETMFSIGRLMKDEMKFSSSVADLSMLQIQALLFIEKQGQVQMKDLAARFTITLPTATSLSDNLIRAGLIKRMRNTEDRRVVTLALSSKGKKLLVKAMDERNKKMRTMLSYLSQGEKKDLLKILLTITKNLGNEK